MCYSNTLPPLDLLLAQHQHLQSKTISPARPSVCAPSQPILRPLGYIGLVFVVNTAAVAKISLRDQEWISAYKQACLESLAQRCHIATSHLYLPRRHVSSINHCIYSPESRSSQHCTFPCLPQSSLSTQVDESCRVVTPTTPAAVMSAASQIAESNNSSDISRELSDAKKRDGGDGGDAQDDHTATPAAVVTKEREAGWGDYFR